MASTSSGRPWAWAIAATAGRSSTSSPGLPTISASTSRVSGRIAARERVQVARIDEGRLDAEARQGQAQQVDACRHRGCAPRRCGEPAPISVAIARCSAAWPLAVATRRDAALERRDALLEHGDRRVRDPAVDVAGALQVEQPRGVVGVGEDVGGRLVDRHRARASGGVGRLPGMQRQGVWIQEPGIDHGAPGGGGRVTRAAGRLVVQGNT